MSRRLLTVAVLMTSLSVFCASALGQSLVREEGANAAALGVADAVRSTAVGSTSLFFNPAAMHQMLQYAIETGYQYNSPTAGHVFTTSVVDSATNQMLAMGLSYSYVTGEELTTDLDRSGHMLRIAMASGYRGKDFSVHAGIGMRYLSLTIDDDANAEAFTLDAGVLITLANMFRLAVVGHNLIETDLSETPRQLGLGASVLWKRLILSFDAVLDFETLDETEAQYNVGLEYAIGGQVPVRVGYQHDQIMNMQSITGGIGYVSRVMALDFGFRQNLERKDDNIFSFNVKAFIP